MVLGYVSTSQQILLLLQQLIQEFRNMSGSLSNAISQLQVSVTNLTTVDQSATALIQGFSQQLATAVQAAASAGATSQQLQALADLQHTIDTQTQNLAAAVAANTPAASGPNAVTPPAGPQPQQATPPAPGATGDTGPAPTGATGATGGDTGATGATGA